MVIVSRPEFFFPFGDNGHHTTSAIMCYQVCVCVGGGGGGFFGLGSRGSLETPKRPKMNGAF